MQSDDHPIGGGDADGRGAADAESFDGFPNRLDVGAIDFDEFDGQEGLVDEAQMAVHAADPVESIEIFHNL